MERGGERKEGRGGRVDDRNGGELNERMVKVGSEIPSTCKCYSPLHLVLVEGIKESQPLDADTVLWNKNKRSIGKVKIQYSDTTCVININHLHSFP